METININEYNAWIGGIARRYKQSQIKAATAVNVEMLEFYWSLGADIVRLEKYQPWGSKFAGFDESVALFFSSLFNKAHNQFLKGLVRDFQRLFLDYEVSIPVNQAGSIDLDFIRAFVRGTMKLAISGVIAWKDKEIAATRGVISESTKRASSVVAWPLNKSIDDSPMRVTTRTAWRRLKIRRSERRKL